MLLLHPKRKALRQACQARCSSLNYSLRWSSKQSNSIRSFRFVYELQRRTDLVRYSPPLAQRTLHMMPPNNSMQRWWRILARSRGFVLMQLQNSNTLASNQQVFNVRMCETEHIVLSFSVAEKMRPVSVGLLRIWALEPQPKVVNHTVERGERHNADSRVNMTFQDHHNCIVWRVIGNEMRCDERQLISGDEAVAITSLLEL